MPRIKLNNDVAKRLKVEKRTDYFDSKTPGLMLRVDPSDRKVWCVRYAVGIRRTRYILGEYPSMTYATARLEAGRVRDVVRDGRDPQVERRRRRDAMNMEQLAERYLASITGTLKSAPRYRQYIQNDILPTFAKQAVEDINRPDVRNWLRKIKSRAPGMCNILQSIMGNLLNFAVDEGIITVSPIWRMSQLVKSKRRERLLKPEELATIWAALEGRTIPASRALRVHMLTGQRSSEVREMRIGDLAGCWWHLPKTKAGRKHRVFLAPPVRAILQEAIGNRYEGPVFCAAGRDRSIAKQNYNLHASKIKEVPDWRPHDFRHTFASWLYSHENLEEHIIWALLNHKGPGQVTRDVYNHHRYTPQRERWFAAYADYVMRCVRGEHGAVVNFPGGR